MSYSPDDPALQAEVDASLERWDKLRAEHSEWTGDMLMAIAELCTVFSVALTAKFGVPVHVSFDPAPIEPLVVRRTPAEWCELTGIEILDHDGWRGVHSDRAWTDPLTREEFLVRAGICTTRRWPSPLLDEAGE